MLHLAYIDWFCKGTGARAVGQKFRTSVPDQRLVAIDEILGKIILIPKGKELVVVDSENKRAFRRPENVSF